MIETTFEIWSAIRSTHKDDLMVMVSYSDPDGDHQSRIDLDGRIIKVGTMYTEYGFKGLDKKFMVAKTTWDINPDDKYNRKNVLYKHKYWLNRS